MVPLQMGPSRAKPTAPAALFPGVLQLHKAPFPGAPVAPSPLPRLRTCVSISATCPHGPRSGWLSRYSTRNSEGGVAGDSSHEDTSDKASENSLRQIEEGTHEIQLP